MLCLFCVCELNQVPKPGHSSSFNNPYLLLRCGCPAVLITLSLHTSLICFTIGHVVLLKPIPRHWVTSKHAMGLRRQFGWGKYTSFMSSPGSWPSEFPMYKSRQHFRMMKCRFTFKRSLVSSHCCSFLSNKWWCWKLVYGICSNSSICRPCSSSLTWFLLEDNVQPGIFLRERVKRILGWPRSNTKYIWALPL